MEQPLETKSETKSEAALRRLETQDSLLGARKAGQWRSVADGGVHPSHGHAGEGRRILSRARRGYWVVTLFATEGRPWPRLLLYYVLYAIGAVSFAMLYRLDEDGDPTFICDTDIFAVCIMALLYLIVFRTNSAYARWLEGRQAWGDMVSTLRDFVRAAAANLEEPWRVDNLARHAIAYAIACKQQLRGDVGVDELKAILSARECDAVVGARHRALAVLGVLSAQVSEARRARRLDARLAMDLERMLSTLGALLGACERILGTRMPFGYIVHIRAFLAFFLMCMPFTLVDDARWAAIPIAIVLAYALLGLERMALDVEQPFGFDYSDLPLDELVHEMAAKDILEMLVRTSHGGVLAFGTSEQEWRERQRAGALAAPSVGERLLRLLPSWLNPLELGDEAADGGARCVPSSRARAGLRPLPMPQRRRPSQIPQFFKPRARAAAAGVPAVGGRRDWRAQLRARAPSSDAAKTHALPML